MEIWPWSGWLCDMCGEQVAERRRGDPCPGCGQVAFVRARVVIPDHEPPTRFQDLKER